MRKYGVMDVKWLGHEAPTSEYMNQCTCNAVQSAESQLIFQRNVASKMSVDFQQTSWHCNPRELNSSQIVSFTGGGERGGRVYFSTTEHTLHNLICIFFT